MVHKNKILAIIFAKDDEHLIKYCLLQVSELADGIVLFLDESNRITNEYVRIVKDHIEEKVDELKIIPVRYDYNFVELNEFAYKYIKNNYLGEYDYLWKVLGDLVFEEGFEEYIKGVIEKYKGRKIIVDLDFYNIVMALTHYQPQKTWRHPYFLTFNEELSMKPSKAKDGYFEGLSTVEKFITK